MSATSRPVTEIERRHDVILAAVVFVGAVLSAALSSIAELYGTDQAPLWQALVYAVVIAAPLALRRRVPGIVAVVIAAAYFVAVSLRIPEVFVGNIAMFISLYTVGAWMSDRRRAMIVRVGIIVGMLAWLLVVMYRDAIDFAEDAGVIVGALSPYLAFMLLQLLLNVLYFAGAYYFGERSWTAAAERAALAQRTADLERERELTAAQAVALDRVRIARELHDVVAHHVSVMGVQAGAARTIIDRDPSQATQILAAIETSSREAISELRHLLETLREHSDTVADAPSTLRAEGISDLVRASNEAGIPTEFTIIGEPAEIPAVTEVALYRIAQESLTNARRHAGVHTRADVRLRYLPDEVELEVVTTGRHVAEPRPGLGILGMRERTIAAGGAIEVGPRERGGFRVRVRFPRQLGALTAPDVAKVTA